jgi:trk system potassium uptake protein TrkA
MKRVSFAAGETIFEQDDTSEYAYLLIFGSVEIDRDGFTATIEASELFGEAALVDRPRMACAVAKTECQVLAVSKDELLSTIKTEPDAALEIVEAMFNRLALVIDELNSLRRYRWKRI